MLSNQGFIYMKNTHYYLLILTCLSNISHAQDIEEIYSSSNSDASTSKINLFWSQNLTLNDNNILEFHDAISPFLEWINNERNRIRPDCYDNTIEEYVKSLYENSSTTTPMNIDYREILLSPLDTTIYDKNWFHGEAPCNRRQYYAINKEDKILIKTIREDFYAKDYLIRDVFYYLIKSVSIYEDKFPAKVKFQWQPLDDYFESKINKTCPITFPEGLNQYLNWYKTMTRSDVEDFFKKTAFYRRDYFYHLFTVATALEEYLILYKPSKSKVKTNNDFCALIQNQPIAKFRGIFNPDWENTGAYQRQQIFHCYYFENGKLLIRNDTYSDQIFGPEFSENDLDYLKRYIFEKPLQDIPNKSKLPINWIDCLIPTNESQDNEAGSENDEIGGCEDLESDRDYTNEEYRHFYVIDNCLCHTSNPKCTLANVYEVLKSQVNFVAPTTSTLPVENCGLVYLDLGAFGLNFDLGLYSLRIVNILMYSFKMWPNIFNIFKILSLKWDYPNPAIMKVDQKNFKITNFTANETHILHPGKVQRQIILKNGNIFIRSTGEGAVYGDGLQTLNDWEFAMRGIWNSVDEKLKRELLGRIGKSELDCIGIPYYPH